MKIDAQTDASTLSGFGVEAVDLLCSSDIDTLVERFGYALAHGRKPAAAIREDLARCLAEVGSTALVSAPEDSPGKVKYFEPSDTGLFAVVECFAITDNGSKLLVELVVTGSEANRHITLEDISAAA